MSASVGGPGGLAFKAYEIEELVDVYFFRRLGIVLAWAARAARLSPNAVSILAGLVGMIGGALLASEAYDWLGVVLVFGYGVLDSTDGQLARLTGQTSEWGRVLDGLAGYVTHIAAYVAILVRALNAGDSAWVIVAAVLAGVVTIVHAQLYDYHRTSYTSVVVKGRPSLVSSAGRSRGAVVALYERMQRAVAGLHPDVEAAIAARAEGGVVADGDRRRYRERFLPIMPAWNVFGDNVRRFGIAAAVAAGHLEWFFAFVLLLNLPLVAVWGWQRRADARFLEEERARRVRA
ncbi:MAG: CDP-alcohol phosphatidyltransferase family protein [Vicinamibacterales bacterium]